ncbi:hypothetical protein H920_09019 [Fukomys damarensis]|uniref:Uncharacterized protein n=1 Tax=Fukomys damarensis TaxID=885580 RepID=A0A091DH40_FUKDA|nr:hypothetical protein H920_09019 [Fukomys damarensis]
MKSWLWGSGKRWLHSNQDRRPSFPWTGCGYSLVLSDSCSPLDRHRDITHFRQLLCPDPLCEVCNTTTAKVTSLVDPVSPSAQGDSVPPEPSPPLESRFPVDQFHQRHLPLPHPCHITPKKRKLFSNQKPLLSLDDSSDDLSSAEASFGEHSTAYQVKPRSPSFLTSDNPPLLEGDIKKTDDFLMCSEQEKGTKSFAKLHEPDYRLITSGERPELAADQQYSAPTFPVWIIEGKPEEIHMNQKLAGPKNLEDHLEQKCSQFCRLRGLPRQSLNPLVPTSGDCFSEVSDISKAHESPVLPHTPPLSFPEVQPQSLSHTLAQSQAQRLHLVQAQGQLQSPTPVLPDSPLDQNRSQEVCFHSTQSEVQSLPLSEIHNLEYNALHRVQESVWGLPPVVPKSQEDVCPSAFKLSSVTQSSEAHMPGSILPKNSTLNTEPKKVEHHLQEKLIQHQWDLPPRALRSPSVVWVCPQGQGL